MTHYAKQMKDGVVVALHTMDRPFTASDMFVPIMEAEYTALLAGWEAAPPEPEPTDEISDSEALSIITGGTV